MLDVRVVDTVAGLRALEGAWNELAAGDERGDVFGAADWLREWWRAFGERGPHAGLWLGARSPAARLAAQRAELHVLAVADGPKLAAIVPLVRVEVRSGGRWLRALASPLNPHAPRSALVARGSAAGAMAALIEHLAAQRSWDVLALDGIPRASPQLRALERAARERGLACVVGQSWSHSRLTPGGSWGEYLQQQGRHFRKHLWQAERALARLGALQVERACAPAAVESALQGLLRVDAQSWKASSGESIGLDDALGAHYANVARAFAEHGSCEVWSLAMAGELAAVCLCLVWRDAVYTLKTSYRLSLASAAHSPGVVLFARILEDAHERKRAVDFVGRTPFSERFTDARIEFEPMVLFRSRWDHASLQWLGRAAQLRRALASGARRAIRGRAGAAPASER